MKLRVGDTFEYTGNKFVYYKVTEVRGDLIGYAVRDKNVSVYSRQLGTFSLCQHASKIKILSKGKLYPQRKAI